MVIFIKIRKETRILINKFVAKYKKENPTLKITQDYVVKTALDKLKGL